MFNTSLAFIELFFVNVWCGANQSMHAEAQKKIFGWKQALAQDIYKRYFGRLTQVTSRRLSDHLYSWIFKPVQFDNYTLDCDSSVLTRYREQQRAKHGYNLRYLSSWYNW